MCTHVVVMVGRAAAVWAAAGLIRDHVLTALCIPAVCGSLCALALTLHRQNHETEKQSERLADRHGLFVNIHVWLCWVRVFVFTASHFEMTPELAEVQKVSLDGAAPRDQISCSKSWRLGQSAAPAPALLGFSTGHESWWQHQRGGPDLVGAAV